MLLAHHPPVLFLGLFLLFLGFTQAYSRHQDPLILKEGLLVGFFLAGLVVLGGHAAMVAAADRIFQPGRRPSRSSVPLGLTAITDNAALTYLGSLIAGLSEHAKYMLVAGAVAGGGLTVIANAPNPAGFAILKDHFDEQSISPFGLFAAALVPTVVAVACFRGIRGPVAEIVDWELWAQWFAQLDRSFLFLLILPFVVAAVGLWAHYLQGSKAGK